MITDDNLITTRLYTLHHMEEETVAHQMRRQITRFSHQMTSRASPEWHGHHPPTK